MGSGHYCFGDGEVEVFDPTVMPAIVLISNDDIVSPPNLYCNSTRANLNLSQHVEYFPSIQGMTL